MRLTSLRLSGFKSFVDPTSLGLNRQLMGIVGPNGCGKSNVIDAVRWVLGESRASELRGENMHDVIFNGSGTRKPAGRASVELVFDNSAGRLGGPWAQYAELSVKRVLSRDGQSVYSINNQVVRRKDVHDLFLGTGLGPRAYAIIGQGMITRVIESKPEELRTFLEEAAGVSKYRERRRETEGRLSDARENLARVEDIRLEIEQRIGTLTEQAAVARTFQEKSLLRKERQALLLALRRHEALTTLSRHQGERNAVQTELEGLSARLTGAALEAEQARPALDSTASELQRAQAALFEVNTKIAGQEAEDRAQQQIRDRALQSQGVLALTLERLTQEREEVESLLLRAQEEGLAATAALAAQGERVEHARAALSPLEERAQSAAMSLSELRATLAAAEAESRSLLTRQEEAQQNQARLAQRLKEIETAISSLEVLSPDALSDARTQQERALTEHQEARSALDRLTSELAGAEASLVSAQSNDVHAQNQAGQARAQLQAQASLLHQMEAKGQQTEWLEARSVSHTQRLWTQLSVSDGWQTAVGAALSERLSAVALSNLAEVLSFTSNPPSRVVFFEPPRGDTLAPSDSLATKVEGADVAAETARRWLASFRVIESLAQAIDRRGELGADELFVTREGHLIGRHALTLHGESDDDGSGLLAQRDAVRGLQIKVNEAEAEAEISRAALLRAEQALAAARTSLKQAQQSEERLRGQAHEAELFVVRLQERADRLASQSAELARAQSGLQAELAQTLGHLERLAAEARASAQAVQSFRDQIEASASESELASQALTAAREILSNTEREQQDLRLAERSAQEQCSRYEAQKVELARRQEESEERQAAAQAELQSALDALAQSALQSLLASRIEHEQGLLAARQAAEAASDVVRQLEERRLSIEREALPLRERLSQSDVAIAGAQATIDQLDQQLSEQEVDIVSVVAGWPNGLPPPDLPKANALSAEVSRLSRDIESLGSVNLTALDELEQAREREGFLKAQAADLLLAVETLEDAISKIDRESRALLQSTYDSVNDNLSRLFPTLFGGGDARLVLTGEEILDSGLQVMAQPPGKRNTSIHLLSGGEKTLTATALVFALFQLNPAPFCLLDEVDAPLDDTNTERLCGLIREMSAKTQFIFITHNKITMEMAEHLVGVTMQEQGVSRLVAVDLEAAHAFGQEAA